MSLTDTKASSVLGCFLDFVAQWEFPPVFIILRGVTTLQEVEFAGVQFVSGCPGALKKFFVWSFLYFFWSDSEIKPVIVVFC